MHNIFSENWEYVPIDLATHPYHSFAIDDVLQEEVSLDQVPKVRAWVHNPYIILGLHDARLPHLHDGLKFLKESGYDYIVRNSGGLGVVLDEGVLNISIVVPKSTAPMIEAGYELMLEMVRLAFPGVEIRAYEIKESYCPGNYDLSINGKKFAGISQRRVKNGIAVQTYLCVTGSGKERAEIMREFYNHAKKGEETKFTYPEIKVDSMASLNELLGENWTINEVLERFLHSIEGEIRIRTESLKNNHRYYQSIKSMKKRNRYIRGDEDQILFPE